MAYGVGIDSSEEDAFAVAFGGEFPPVAHAMVTSHLPMSMGMGMGFVLLIV